ncbi:MAG: segregation and condensation protein A [Parcubacteria group bacterium Gr01-1014_13]|nr:MAG: segregation and condensation protein A [Parcubacteria group bacterium Gr01-1014_13]
MPTDLKLEKFEGPLDLLLQLVDQEKLGITEIALAKVTEQFFSYLDKLEKNRPEELADFLVVAARLIYLKSHSLLQYAYPEEEDSGPGLADQLKLYKQYVEASKVVNSLWEANKIAYGRIEPPVKNKEFILPLNAAAKNLHDSMVFLLGRLKPLEALPKVTIDHSVSIKQKIDSIRNLLKNGKELSFKDILSSAQNKTEVIVSFLAILELVKQQSVRFRQVNAFEDLLVVKNT